MKSSLILALAAALFFFSCQSEPKAVDHDALVRQISDVQKALAAAPGTPPADKMEELIKLTDQYVAAFPKHEGVCLNYLYKASEAARALGKFDKAVANYNLIGSTFERNNETGKALFLKAYTYDHDLHNLDSAKIFYQQFISGFPQHEFNDDAQALLDNLGKSDEEMLKALEAKQASKKDAATMQKSVQQSIASPDAPAKKKQ